MRDARGCALIKPGPPNAYGQIVRDEDIKGPLDNTRIWVDDVNTDGKLDILVGDLVTPVSPADGLSEKEFKKRFGDWMKEQHEASEKLGAAGNDEKEQAKARERFQQLYERRSEFMKEDRTGFIWLYLRK